MRHNRVLSGLTILGLVAGTVFVVGAAFWTVSNMRYGRMLERELAALKTEGYALTVAEVKPAPVPEADNAARLYLPLFQVSFDPAQASPGNSSDNGLGRFKVDRTDLPDVLAARAIIESPDSQRALATLKRASAMPFCVFPVRWDDGFSSLFPHLAQFRQGTRLVCAQAVLKAHDGKLPEALDWLTVSYRMADQAAAEPTLIAQLVAIAMRAISDKAAHQIIAPAALTPAQARGLYDQLARAQIAATYEAGMRMELAQGLTSIEGLRQRRQDLRPLLGELDNPYPGLQAVLYSGLASPLLKLEETNYARAMRQVIARSRQPYRETAGAPDIMAGHNGPGYMLAHILVPVYGRATAKRDQSLAATRLLQIVLALKAQKQSLGSYPPVLTGLVWQSPLEDPFSGKPFVYRPRGNGFLLYSIGPNLKDDGGKGPSQPSKILEEGDMVWLCRR